MLLRSESSPPFTTVQITSSSVTSFTRKDSRPLLTRIVSPGVMLSGRPVKFTATRVSSPGTSRVVKVNSCPSIRLTGPFSKVLMRYSGPLVSNMMAMGRPSFSRTRLMRWMRSRWSAWVPWEKFSRATFMPASQSWVSISSLSQAGPMVQMILVLRIDFLLVCLAIKEGMRVGEKENGHT